MQWEHELQASAFKVFPCPLSFHECVYNKQLDYELEISIRALVNFHTYKSRANIQIALEYIYTVLKCGRSKFYRNPLCTHFENANKRPSFC